MTPEIKFAKNLVKTYLNKNGEPTNAGLNEMSIIMVELADNNYSRLLEHCKAIRNILDEAIKQMESEKQ